MTRKTKKQLEDENALLRGKFEAIERRITLLERDVVMRRLQDGDNPNRMRGTYVEIAGQGEYVNEAMSDFGEILAKMSNGK